MDRITLAGIRLFTHVGCTPEERKVGQHLELDLVVEGSFEAAGRADDIERSVDYAKAYEVVARAVGGGEARLLEAVAERAAQALLALPGVEAARVRVRKDAPPIPHGHARHAEVEIERRRRP